MKSLEARFAEVSATPSRQGNSSIINFFYAVKHAGFSRKIISKWFNKLVEKDDYDKRDKKELVDYAVTISKKPEAVVK